MESARILSCLGLVHHISRRFRGLDPENITGAGMLALVESAGTFDESRGVPFSSWASMGIAWACGRELRRQLDRGAVETPLELVFDGEPVERREIGVVDACPVLPGHVRGLLEHLSPRSRDVIRSRFGIGCEPETLECIGRRLGISKARVGGLEAAALARLRKLASVRTPFQRAGKSV